MFTMCERRRFDSSTRPEKMSPKISALQHHQLDSCTDILTASGSSSSLSTDSATLPSERRKRAVGDIRDECEMISPGLEGSAANTDDEDSFTRAAFAYDDPDDPVALPVGPKTSMTNKTAWSQHHVRNLDPDEYTLCPYSRIGRMIGSGTYGCVFQLAGTDRAMKRINSATNEGHLDLVKKNVADIECDITLHLCSGPGAHRNLVSVFDAFTVADWHQHWIVMENCTGGMLKNAIVTNLAAKPPGDAWDVAKQLFSALEFCHRNRVAHCDIKSENVMYSKQGGTLKIIDFSLARYCDASGAFDFSGVDDLCSVETRPPEASLRTLAHYSGPVGLRAEDVAPCSTASDIWSVACVICEYLLTFVPFSGINNMAIIRSAVSRIGAPSESDSTSASSDTSKTVLAYIRNVLLEQAQWSSLVPRSDVSSPKRRSMNIDRISSVPHSASGGELWNTLQSRGVDCALICLLSKMLKWSPEARCSAAYALSVCDTSPSLRPVR